MTLDTAREEVASRFATINSRRHDSFVAQASYNLALEASSIDYTTTPSAKSSTTTGMASVLNIASTTKTFRVAVVGVGLVGGEFIRQLLAFPSPSPFRLVSLSSSKSSVYAPDGLAISVSNWKNELASSGQKPDLQFLLRELAALVKPGQEVVLVDNTSSNEVAALYPQFLRFGVNIVTPNKKAFSADLALYEQILAAALEGGAKFLNEATVGAGLPIISTLKDLVATGDKVRVL